LTFFDPATRVLLRTRPSPLTPADAARLRGARLTGPPPQPAGQTVTVLVCDATLTVELGDPSHAPPASLTMAVLTHDQHGGRPAGERRQAALAAFLAAGMPAPPSTALTVQALASARRAVAAHH
jgi:hypothetical protein